MDSFISLDLDFRLNGNKQHSKFSILTTIFYDLFDENILVQNLKKHIKIIPHYGTKGEGKTFFIWFFLFVFVMKKLFRHSALLQSYVTKNVSDSDNFQTAYGYYLVGYHLLIPCLTPRDFSLLKKCI